MTQQNASTHDIQARKPVLTASSLQLIKRLLREYVRPHLGIFMIALLFMLVSAAMTGVMAKMMEPVIDQIFTQGKKEYLMPVAVAILVVFLVRGLATYGQTVLMSKIGQLMVSNIQRTMFGHLIYADLAFFHIEQSGRLISRFVTDTQLIRTAILESLTGFGKNAFTLIVLLGVMFYQDMRLSVITLVVFPTTAFLVARLSKRLRSVSRNAQVETGQLTAVLGQALQGNKHVKAYGMESFEQARISTVIERIYDLMYKSFKVAGRATPVSEMLSGLTIVAIIVYGGQQVIAGESTAGKLFSFITAFMLAYEPMKRLARLNNTVQSGLAAVERMYTLLDTKPQIDNRPDAIELHTQSPVVKVEDISFTYADGTQAINGLSLEAPAGKTVALVGASGSGKSTLLNLLPRFYDVTGGRITIDGHDIRGVTLQSLRANMALVSQEVAIFNDSVRDNIAYGTPGATDDQIIAAAKAAAAHDFIADLPQGYDTVVGENGVKLSGGQRQRISIARAFLRNAPILLLDEATSALDSQSERLIQSAIEDLQKDKTTIVVAHRLSTIINADRIYVMSNGKVVEQGTHSSLLAQNGAYAMLYGELLKETA